MQGNQIVVLQTLARDGDQMYRKTPDSQIGDGARYLEDPAIAAGGKAEAIRDHLQQLLPRVVDRAEATDVAGLHVRIGVQAQGDEALALDLPCSLDTGADRRRGFAVNRVGQVAVRHAWHFDVQVNTVEQGTGQPTPVALNHGRGAGAGFIRFS